MKYIIMADGKGTRWHNYKGIPKHFIEIDGETLLHRTVRLLGMHKDGRYGAEEILITSHDPRYDTEGAVRYEPENNVLEIDRFTEELIDDDICFLYGDTYYSEETMKRIMEQEVDDLLFFGNEKSIVAVKVADGELFRKHKARVRNMFTAGEISHCKGWQVYRSFEGLPLDSEDYKEIKGHFIRTDEATGDFNAPEDLEGKSEN